VSAPPSPSSRYIMILMLFDLQYLIISLRTLLISTQAVLGKSVWLRTRYAYDCVLDRLSWDSPIWLTHEAEGELRFWFSMVSTFLLSVYTFKLTPIKLSALLFNTRFTASSSLQVELIDMRFYVIR
jgi:hypothetical protein